MRVLKLSIILVIVLSSVTYAFESPYDRQIQTFTRHVFPEYPCLWLYFKSQMRHESYYNPKALSKSAAKGLMQLKDGTYGDVKREFPGLVRGSIWDPTNNLKAGILYNYMISREYEHLDFRNFRGFMFSSYLLGPNLVHNVRGESFRFDEFLVRLHRLYPKKYSNLIRYLHRINSTYKDYTSWHKAPKYSKSLPHAFACQ